MAEFQTLFMTKMSNSSGQSDGSRRRSAPADSNKSIDREGRCNIRVSMKGLYWELSTPTFRTWRVVEILRGGHGFISAANEENL